MPFSHRASETIQLLKQMTPHVIPPTLWPPKSTHLNPKQYAVWGIMQFTRRRLRTASADCGGMGTTRPAYVIDNAIRQWCRRLRGCVDADGGQFEHYDWHSDYHSGRHCRFLSVWLYCIDCIATCSALYSLALINLFIAKNIYYIFHKVQCQ